jgi:hypothetical protein
MVADAISALALQEDVPRELILTACIASNAYFKTNRNMYSMLLKCVLHVLHAVEMYFVGQLYVLVILFCTLSRCPKARID